MSSRNGVQRSGSGPKLEDNSERHEGGHQEPAQHPNAIEAGKPTGREDRLEKPDDYQISETMTRDWKGKVAFFRSYWHRWAGVSWQRIEDREIKLLVRDFIRHKTWGTKASMGRVNAVAQMAELDCWVDDRLIDKGLEYIPLSNGLYNLNTHKLEQGRAELYITNQLEFPYDENADCPHFRRFLNTSLVTDDGATDWQLISLIQEALGYSFTARTDLKRAFWLLGKPDSGKSTFIALIRALMGSFYGTLDLSQMGSNRFLLSGIVGKRVIAATEADAGSVLPDALFKTLVGGEDEIYADVKNRDAITFKPSAKLWWGMNKAPIVTDRSGAVFNRLVLIPFNRSVPPNERILNLIDLLTAERAGIFTWAMDGYKRLVRAGKFTECEQSIEKRRDYQRRSDTEALFMDEMCNRTPEGKVSATTLYTAYKMWCSDSGFHAKSLAAVAEDWQRLGLTRTRQNGKSVWHGVEIRTGFQ